MQPRANRFVEVELVDDDAAGNGTGAVDARPRPRRAARRRVPGEVVLAAVGALLLGGAGVALARGGAGADRAPEAPVAQVTGLTSSLAVPLREDWRAAGGGLIAVMTDVVVHSDDEGVGIVGTDLRTGATRYSVPGMCQLVSAAGDAGARSRGFGAAFHGQAGDVLLCVDDSGAGEPHQYGAREASAHVVDPLTGTTRHTIALAAGDTWTVVDGDVVSIGLSADRRVLASRRSVLTGEQRWAYLGTRPVPDPTAGWNFLVSDGTVGLRLGEWSVTLDVHTGAETEAPTAAGAPSTTRSVMLPDGTSLEYAMSSAGSVQTVVHPHAGGQPVTVPGFVLPLAVDDGSVPGVAVTLGLESWTVSQGLSVVDLRSGERRWTSDVQAVEAGLLSGVVLVTDAARTVALDPRTGRILWESTTGSTDGYGGWELVTDGRRILVIEGDGQGRQVVARDARTGDRVWSVESPFVDAALVPLADGTVLVVGPEGVAALGP